MSVFNIDTYKHKTSKDLHFYKYIVGVWLAKTLIFIQNGRKHIRALEWPIVIVVGSGFGLFKKWNEKFIVHDTTQNTLLVLLQ